METFIPITVIINCSIKPELDSTNCNSFKPKIQGTVALPLTSNNKGTATCHNSESCAHFSSGAQSRPHLNPPVNIAVSLQRAGVHLLSAKNQEGSL